MNIKKLDRLDHFLERQEKGGPIPGASLLVEHNGKRVYEKYFGTDRKDSIYKAFEFTQVVTATAAMLLYERGQLDLQRKVSDYLPGFAGCKVAAMDGIHRAENPIRIRDLFNMTSGIVGSGDYGEAGQSMTKTCKEARIQRGSGILQSNVEVCNKLSEAYLAFEPGTSFRLGLSAEVLAAVIEVISDMPFEEYVGKMLFDPLNMQDSGFRIASDKEFRQAVLYRRDRYGKPVRAEEDIRRKLNMERPTEEPWLVSGGIGMYTTIEDFGHFTEMLLNRGAYHGKELLGRRTFAYLTSPQLTGEQLQAYRSVGGDGYSFGNYFKILTDPAAAGSNGTAGEFGCETVTGSCFFIDPAEELIVIYMQQVDNGRSDSFVRGLKQIVYGSL